MWIHDTNFRRYAARASDCSACQLRKRCLGTDTARRRNLHIINNRGEATHASRMNAKIDALRGRQKATPNGCSIAWSTTSKRSPTLLISGVCDRAIRAPGPPFAHRPAKNVESPGSDPKSSPRSVRRGRRGQAASNSVLIRQSGCMKCYRGVVKLLF